MYSEDDLIPLSALQHFIYCPRQCALIHVEIIWRENSATAEGRLLHERADSGATTLRGNCKTVCGLLLRSLKHGLTGKADVVEFHREDNLWRPFPVEYKRGGIKKHEADRVQLCAQALCLEEMLGLHTPEGALFYGQQRRRVPVSFDPKLREFTIQTARAVHALFREAVVPLPEKDARCNGCSLHEECQPKLSNRSAARYLESLWSGP